MHTAYITGDAVDFLSHGGEAGAYMSCIVMYWRSSGLIAKVRAQI